MSNLSDLALGRHQTWPRMFGTTKGLEMWKNTEPEEVFGCLGSEDDFNFHSILKSNVLSNLEVALSRSPWWRDTYDTTPISKTLPSKNKLAYKMNTPNPTENMPNFNIDFTWAMNMILITFYYTGWWVTGSL